MKDDIKSRTPAELEAALTEIGEPRYRAGQVFSWLQRGVRSFEEMTDLPKTLRLYLEEHCFISAPTVERKQVSRDGTVKYLWRMADGNCVETVLMQYHYGNTVCVSTEVGCAMGCRFCASASGGLVRRLTAGEILDQVLFTQMDSGRPISRIVLMGIGEPLDNLDAVLRFLELVNRPEGLHIGMRRIALSTCGLCREMEFLAARRLQLTLSVSLHAPDDETRNLLMPVNRSCGVDLLLETCRRYALDTGRRVSFEYAMIRDVNDALYHAELLSKKLCGMDAHVNLIPLNDVKESPLRPSRRETVAQFQKVLEQNGIPVTVRRRLGGDIDASCGQLRKKQLQEQ